MKWRIGGAALVAAFLAAVVGTAALRSSITGSLREVAGAARAAAPAAPDAVSALLVYVADSCAHGRDICQHELQKAVALCEGDGPDLLRIGGCLDP